MIFNFDSIPKFCISLSRSAERRRAVKKEFEKHKLNVSFFDAVDKQELILPELSAKQSSRHIPDTGTGVLACMLSHIALLRKAKELRLPALCIFEDDVKLCDDFASRIKYIEGLENFDFDFFLMGGHFSTVQEKGHPTEWKHINRITSMNGTYAYIITEKVYDFVLRNITYNFGMDEFYGNHVYKRFTSYAMIPFLAACNPGYSEITEADWEYENIHWHYQQEKFSLHSEDFKSKAHKKIVVKETVHISDRDPAEFFRKRENFRYLQLAGTDKRIYDDITLYMMHNKDKITIEGLQEKMKTYNIPFIVKNDDSKLFIDMETFRIPEEGYLNE